MGDWILTRGVNGEYGYVNTSTGQFRTSIPVESTTNSTTSRSIGYNSQQAKSGNQRARTQASINQANSYNNRQQNIHNYADATQKLVQKHQVATIDSNGNAHTVQANYTPQNEAPMEQVSPEFDLLSATDIIKNLYGFGRNLYFGKKLLSEIDHTPINTQVQNYSHNISYNPYLTEDTPLSITWTEANSPRLIPRVSYSNVKYKERTPRVYQREKYRYVEEPEELVESVEQGIQPAYIYPKDGKITASRKHPGYNENERMTIPNARAAIRVQHNYENAMHRRRSYTYKGLKRNLFYGNEIGIKHPDNESLLLDATAQYIPDNNNLFHPTHFAPEGLRSGADLIRRVADSSQPTMFTVTSDLSPMLEKQGFVKVSQIPQIFDGDIVMKDVLVNRATTKESLLNKIQEFKDPDEPITLEENEMLDKIMETLNENRAIKRFNKDLYYPQQNNFPLSDLLKQSKQK